MKTTSHTTLLSLGASLLVANMAVSAASTPALSTLQLHQRAITEVESLQGKGRYDEAQVLLKFRPGTSEAEKARIIQSLGTGGRRLHRQALAAGVGDTYVVKLDRRHTVASAMTRAWGEGAIENVAPDWILTLQDDVSNDPGFSSLWGMQSANSTPANPYGTGVADLWAKGYVCSASTPTYVAVLDTGVRTTHEDLRDNLFKNPVDSTVDQQDNDGNGYIDDVNGWNFYANTNNVEDDHGHGTHVSGTIAARHNNGLGVAGMCGDGAVKILPVKVCNSAGGCPTSAVLQGLNYVVDLKKNHGINVAAVNLSLGSLSGSPNTTGIEYFQAANDAGILVAAAAGNNGSNTDTTYMWPAGLAVDNILSVGNIGSNGVLSSSSNYGETSVDIAAPGGSIYSTVNTNDSAYGWKSGTSMATPHVAGAIALYRVLHPQSSVAEVRAAILSSAHVEPSLQGKVAGARRLDVSGWSLASTTFKATCGIVPRGTSFWFLVQAYTDASMKAPLRYMGITYNAYDAAGNLLNTYVGRTNNNGAALWSFNRNPQPWGTQYSVVVHTDDGASRTYASTELKCPTQ